MNLATTLYSLGVAVGAGLLVGTEREQSQPEGKKSRRFGGVRTFAILGLLGGLTGVLQPTFGWAMSCLVLAILGATLIVNFYLKSIREQPRGITTEVAALAVYLLGLLACSPVEGMMASHRWAAVAASAVVVMTLLSYRDPLHQLADRISNEDLYAVAKLGLLLAIALPLLPDQDMGPQGRINPFEIGLFIALIAGMGFFGYLAVRALGASQGMILTALFGGLASSTAVTLNFASRAQQSPAITPIAALGVIVASAVVFPRMLIEVAFAAPGLVAEVALPLSAMGALSAALAMVLYLRFRSTEQSGADLEIKNPFALAEAFKFGVVYTLVKVISGYAVDGFGDAGIYASAALAGLTNIHAITLSLSGLYQEGSLEPRVAVAAMVLAVTTNTLLKGGLAFSLGGSALGMRVMGIFVPVLALGGAVSWWLLEH